MPPPPPKSRLSLETIGGVTVVSFVDSSIVSEDVLNAVRDELNGLVGPGKSNRLLLNLGNIRKYSTEFLGNLMGLASRVKKSGGKLKLCSIAPNLMDAVRILHLEKVFEIYPEEQKALDTF